MAPVHSIFQLRHVAFLPVPLPHHPAKENVSRDVAVLCVLQQGAKAGGMPVLSVPQLLLTLDQDLPYVCQESGSGSSARNPKPLLTRFPHPLTPLPPPCLSLDSRQKSLELVLSSYSDRIPHGYAESASSGQLCLSLWHLAKPGPECIPGWAPTTPPASLWDTKLLASSSSSAPRRAGKPFFLSFWRWEKTGEGGKKR